MSKILLVEDDNNLREIYEARLMAEGYTIVTAPDGEAALAIASKEKPDLVISDVMMPNISGFDMLDIMRNTEGLKHVHVIMLTALSQAEDQARADALGADRYLIKSQVTLEDIVNNAKVLLGDVPPAEPEAAAPAMATPVAPTDVPVAMEPTTPPTEPIAPAAPPIPVETPVAAEPVAVNPPTVTEPVPAPAPLAEPVMTVPAPVAVPAEPTDAPVVDAPVAAEPTTVTPVTPVAEPTDDFSASVAQEEQAIADQINAFAGPTTSAVPAAPPMPDAQNDALMAAAVDQLAAGVPGAPAPVTADAVNTPVTPIAVAEADDVTMAPPHPSDGGTKIIQPIDNPSPAPDINQLLAAEEAKEQGQAQPAIIVAPTTPPNPTSTVRPEDIAL